jgi:hypothetical protein
VLDWSTMLHTSVTPGATGSAAAVPQAAPWLSEFLGTKRAREQDLVRATGLRITLPGRHGG